jgi:hypothetical protein
MRSPNPSEDALGRRDRRDAEELEQAARPLANDREGDQGHRHVLEDQGEHRRPEELDDGRLRLGDVLEVRLRGRGDDVGRDGSGLRRAVADGVALAFRDRTLDDLAVDRCLEAAR